YPGAEFQIILFKSQPAGRLSVHRRPKEIRIMDIALLPEFRGRGIGTTLLKDILAEGERTGRSVSIHVEGFKPALRLYERLGFTKVSLNGVYHLLERPPQFSGETNGEDFSSRQTLQARPTLSQKHPL